MTPPRHTLYSFFDYKEKMVIIMELCAKNNVTLEINKATSHQNEYLYTLSGLIDDVEHVIHQLYE